MRSKDKYRSYAELHENEEEGIDFRVCMTDRAASAAVIALHGGKIEPGTSEIATAIAGESYSLYSFEGLKPRSNQDLHITSTNFDEPRCVLLIATHNFVVSVHGLRGEHEAVDLGGLDIGLRDAACQKLKDAGFIAKVVTRGSHAALSERNICNRGQRRIGVQLELTRGLRNAVLQDRTQLAAFAQAVRTAIAGAANE
jgi:phage replication-related protein YjqB (UPF0714/DUF867 family)